MPQTREGQFWAQRDWNCSWQGCSCTSGHCPHTLSWSNLAVTPRGRGAGNEYLLPDPCVFLPLSVLRPQTNTSVKAQSVLRHQVKCSKNKSHRIGVYLGKFFAQVLQDTPNKWIVGGGEHSGCSRSLVFRGRTTFQQRLRVPDALFFFFFLRIVILALAAEN